MTFLPDLRVSTTSPSESLTSSGRLGGSNRARVRDCRCRSKALEQVARERVLLQDLARRGHEPSEGLPHVGGARGQVDPQARRERERHSRSSRDTSRARDPESNVDRRHADHVSALSERDLEEGGAEEGTEIQARVRGE